ncbi:MAG: cobyric acid synthase [bacterium]|nr:cobyric acid synthase [bacterium]
MNAKAIMIQGTGSHVGKSLITAGLCRVFKQDGLNVAPFKSQNMSNNSFVTEDGKEISRSQAVQAEAAGIKPIVDINPILLKPTSDQGAQIITRGRVVSNMKAVEYDKYKRDAFKIIKRSYKNLTRTFEAIVIEGAGSPAEVNLKNRDIVNMKVAQMAKSPVVLVADIDKGGVFASIIGTLGLLNPKERRMVAGIIINKFRGDFEVLKPGLDFLEKKTKKPVLGVVPYFRDICISDEDSVSIEQEKDCNKNGKIEVKIIKLPRISNFTDFEYLEKEEDVNLKYVDKFDEIGEPDLLIIPGTKNTISDLIYLHSSQIAQKIKTIANNGTMILGICGGYQMLGRKVMDNYNVESSYKEIEGLGLLDIETFINKSKVTYQVKAKLSGLKNLIDCNQEISGYEIHCGRTKSNEDNFTFEVLEQIGGKKDSYEEGSISKDGTIIGTYIHGIFENNEFRNKFINYLRRKKNIKEKDVAYFNKDLEYDKLAKLLRNSLDIPKIYEILNEGISSVR